jgi:tetratricopeptide (TPR) repeat protein/energy-coupling factor transporter ATP-binding protein EcfA2
MIDMTLVKELGVLAPYPGLRPFRRTESIIFFGRDKQVDQMLFKLQQCRFLAIVGASGCGKSSLVRAGLLPALDAGFMLEAGAQWSIVDMHPRNQPFKQLAHALLLSGVLGDAWPDDDPLSLAMVSASLRTGPRSLLELWRESQPESSGSLLLLIDQFEEVFRFRQHQDSNLAMAFVNLLLESARQTERPIYVVITMRSDFIGDCALFPELPEALNHGQFFTPRLSRSQCQAAIEGPAALFGCHLEAGLVNRILNEIGDDPDQLPLMQHALKRLWTVSFSSGTNHMVNNSTRELSLSRYEEIGGVAQALSRHAEEVFEQLAGETEKEGDKRIAQWLFRSLTERSAFKRDSRRPTPLQTVADIARVNAVDVIRVVDVFRHPDCCFVTPPAETELRQETVLDISHESLIRQWTRMKAWVEDEARSAATFRRLADTARRWRDKQAELLRGRELEAIRMWQKNELPNRFWAGRYDDESSAHVGVDALKDFDLAFEFLGKSIEASEDIDAQDDAQDLRVLIEYDVFLSYNSCDKLAVEAVARRLTDEAGLRVFLDSSNIVPGMAWQVELEVAIERSANVAVFIGSEARGEWAAAELRLLLERSVRQRDDFRVIPVLLPGVDPESLPYLLRGRVWVDFRMGLDDTEAFHRLVAGVRGKASEVPSDQIPDEPTPYRGLASFDSQDSSFFFGRDSEISQLIRDLVHNRFVAVVGASGCGKSSLVSAGIWTETASKRLQKENYPPISDWHILRIRTGPEPLELMASALASELPMTRREDLNSREFVDTMRHSGEGLRSTIASVFSNDDRPVLIIVDQFEELFTFTKDSTNNVSDTGRFIDNLLDIVRSKDSRLYLIVTLRSDFLDRCFAYRGLLQLLQNHMLLLGNLSRESLREAILLPAQRVGALFEKGLLEIILRDSAKQPASLPLIQQSLKELWDRRKGPWLTVEAYEEIGGVSGCLERRAEGTFQSLTLEQRSIARSVFGRLINVREENTVSRRRVVRTELYPEGQPRKDIDQVILELSTAMLIVCTDQTVEIAHEALIYAWPRLRYWLNEDREFLLWRERLGTLLTEWERAQESGDALLRGPLLIEAQKWFDQRSQDLTDQEWKFISASLEERERLAREEKERQQRELEAAQRLARAEALRAKDAEERRREQVEAAQKLAEEQKRRAELSEQREKEQKEASKKLRRRAIAVAGAAIAAIILLVISVVQWRTSVSARAGAEKARAAAEKARSLLVNAGDLLRAQGDLTGALRNYRDSLAIAEKLATQDPNNTGWQSDLSSSYERLGDVLLAQGDLAGALKRYRESLVIRQNLATHAPTSADWQRDLSFSYNKIGDALSGQGDLSGALKSYRDSLAIAEKLVRQDPTNAGWQSDLSFSYNKIGDALSGQGDLSGALKSYRDSLAIAEKLVHLDPTNAVWLADLSSSYARLGDVLLAQGDLAGALNSYRDNLAIAEKLVRQDPTNAVWLADLAFSYWRTGTTLARSDPRSQKEARSMIEKGRDILRLLEARTGLTAKQQEWLDSIEAGLRKM